jgi:hypothetical protein
LSAEEYATAEQAEAHVRRLLDILACTTAFAKPRDGAAKHRPSKHGRPASPGAHGAVSGEAAAPPPISEAHDMAAIRPPPKLGEFYDFLSFAHLTPPVHREHPHHAEEPSSRFVFGGMCSLDLTRGACVRRFCSYQEEGGERRFSGRRLLRNRGEFSLLRHTFECTRKIVSSFALV